MLFFAWQALDEPAFAVQYAKMCKTLLGKAVKDASGWGTILITRCLIEFQKDYIVFQEDKEIVRSTIAIFLLRFVCT